MNMFYSQPSCWWFLYFIIQYLAVGGTNCNEIHQHNFIKIKILESEWNTFEREEILSMTQLTEPNLECAIHCSVNKNCSGYLYHRNSGKRKKISFLTTLTIIYFKVNHSCSYFRNM